MAYHMPVQLMTPWDMVRSIFSFEPFLENFICIHHSCIHRFIQDFFSAFVQAFLSELFYVHFKFARRFFKCLCNIVPRFFCCYDSAYIFRYINLNLFMSYFLKLGKKCEKQKLRFCFKINGRNWHVADIWRKKRRIKWLFVEVFDRGSLQQYDTGGGGGG